MNEINSLTHSCMHSFASFAIFAFSGRAVFMIRATGAKLPMLASDEPSCFPALEVRGAPGDGDDEVWDMIGCVTAVAQPKFKRLCSAVDDWLGSRGDACNACNRSDKTKRYQSR